MAALRVGDRIDIPDRDRFNCGVVRFFGPTEFAAGDWVGIELDDEWGMNDGQVQGVAYFRCAPNRGLFLRPQQCQRHELFAGRGTPVRRSPDRATVSASPTPGARLRHIRSVFDELQAQNASIAEEMARIRSTSVASALAAVPVKSGPPPRWDTRARLDEQRDLALSRYAASQLQRSLDTVGDATTAAPPVEVAPDPDSPGRRANQGLRQLQASSEVARALAAAERRRSASVAEIPHPSGSVSDRRHEIESQGSLRPPSPLAAQMAAVQAAVERRSAFVFNRSSSSGSPSTQAAAHSMGRPSAPVRPLPQTDHSSGDAASPKSPSRRWVSSTVQSSQQQHQQHRARSPRPPRGLTRVLPTSSSSTSKPSDTPQVLSPVAASTEQAAAPPPLAWAESTRPIPPSQHEPLYHRVNEASLAVTLSTPFNSTTVSRAQPQQSVPAAIPPEATALRAQVVALTAQLQAYRAQVAPAAAEIADSDAAAARDRSQAMALQGELDVAKAEGAQLAALAEERGSRVSVLSGRLHSLRAEADVAAAEARRSRAELMASQTHCQRLAGELASAQARVADLEASVAEAHEGTAALKRSIVAGGETAFFVTPQQRGLPEREGAAAAAAAATAASRITQLEREVAALQGSTAAYVKTLAAAGGWEDHGMGDAPPASSDQAASIAERNLAEMSELLASGEQARQRLQQQLDDVASNAGYMSAAQIAQQRRDSEEAERMKRQLHAATEAVAALKARNEELAEEAASQAGQRQAAERIADALRTELLAAKAAASAVQQREAAEEAAAAQRRLADQVTQLEAEKAQLVEALRACEDHLRMQEDAAAAAAAAATAATHADSNPHAASQVVVVSARPAEGGRYGSVRPAGAGAAAGASGGGGAEAASLKQRLLKAVGQSQQQGPAAWRGPPKEGEADSTAASSWLPLRVQQPQHPHQGGAGGAAPALPPRPSVAATLPAEQQRRAHLMGPPGGGGSLHQSHSTPEVRDANHRRVWAALSTVLLAGPALADRLRSARAALESATERQVVILVTSSGGRGHRGGGTYHGLYAVVEASDRAPPPQAATPDPAGVLAVRIHGTGPPVLTPAMVTALFKFDTATRELREVGSSHTFTFTTDAVGVDAAHLGGGGGGGAPRQQQ